METFYGCLAPVSSTVANLTVWANQYYIRGLQARPDLTSLILARLKSMRVACLKSEPSFDLCWLLSCASMMCGACRVLVHAPQHATCALLGLLQGARPCLPGFAGICIVAWC